MYPHPQLNSYFQGLNSHMPQKIINRLIDKAIQENEVIGDITPEFMRLASIQPQCYAPHVDVTQAKCAFKQFALPKLKTELSSEDPLITRQAVTTLGDLLVHPEKLIEAIELKIPDSLTDLLKSKDPYLRERVAMIYVTIANQAAGRKAILQNITTVANLSTGLDDNLALVRLQIARVLEALARNYRAGDQLCTLGFIKIVSKKLSHERIDILLLYLDILDLLLRRNFKELAIEQETFEKIVKLLNRKNEKILCKSLSCLAVLCEDYCGKQKALEIDLLRTVKGFLEKERESVKIEAAKVASFVTITSQGKLRILELKMTNFLLCMATQRCCISEELLLPILKILTNVAEAPEGRRILLNYVTIIENIGVGKSEVLRRNRQTLMDVIRWKP